MIEDTSVAIIGAGMMGTGLARLFQLAGWKVKVHDANPDALKALEETVEGIEVYSRIGLAVSRVRLVIEAVVEQIPVKQPLFVKLGELTSNDTILATNSSVIPVGVVSELMPNRDAWRVVGTHFWNPADVIPLVEVIKGPRTRESILGKTCDILASVGKEPVIVHKDVVPGNRLQHALWREALALVDEGVCSPADIDHIVKRSFGLRLPVLGPMENADLVGLELTEQVHQVVFPLLSNAQTPSPTLTRLIEAQNTGVKTGSGLYSSWTPDEVDALREKMITHLGRMLVTKPG